MALDASKSPLGPKAWNSSLDHFQGPGTHICYSKSPDGTNIHNNRPMTPSRGHMWLFEASFLALDGLGIPLVLDIYVSSIGHA